MSHEKMTTMEEKRKISEQKKLAQSKHQGRHSNPDNNPCLKEHEQSFKCLNDNNYKEKVCDIYFENYKTCKYFWLSIKRSRKMKGIAPELPPPEEREKIKAEFLKSRQMT